MYLIFLRLLFGHWFYLNTFMLFFFLFIFADVNLLFFTFNLLISDLLYHLFFLFYVRFLFTHHLCLLLFICIYRLLKNLWRYHLNFFTINRIILFGFPFLPIILLVITSGYYCHIVCRSCCLNQKDSSGGDLLEILSAKWGEDGFLREMLREARVYVLSQVSHEVLNSLINSLIQVVKVLYSVY